MKHKIVACLLLFLFQYINSASACKCMDHPALDKKYCEVYQVIFEGKVDSVSTCMEGYSRAWFTVEGLYKGESQIQNEIRFDCGSDCQMSFQKGETWIIYGQYYKYGRLAVDFCSRCRKQFVQGDDYFTPLNHMSYTEENSALERMFGKQKLSEKIKPDMPGRVLVQPTAWWKLWLLLISVLTLFLINYLVKKIP